MGAPLIYRGNLSLWVGNGIKDLFCDVVAEVAKSHGKDISSVFAEEPKIAGCYGVSGLGIDLEGFFPYFGGKDGFVSHLEVCRREIRHVCPDPEVAGRMTHVLSWAIHLLEGYHIPEDADFLGSNPKTQNRA